MQTLALDSLPLVGVLDTVVTPDGIVLRRSPAWAKAQIADPLHSICVTMPAGVRLELSTDSRSLELDVLVTFLELPDGKQVLPAFDLVAGEVEQSETLREGTRIVVSEDRSIAFLPGGQVTVRFDLTGDASVPVEVWFPHTAVVELRAVRIDDGSTIAPLDRQRPRWVHHGSSISHCIEAPTPTQTWPALVARSLGLDLMNLAMAGNAQLDPHVARTIRDLEADVISLKIGINIVNGDTMRERVFVPALHGFLDQVRDGHPTTPIALITPILCPVAEDAPGPTPPGEGGRVRVFPRPAELADGALSLGRIRELMAQVVVARQDPNLHLMDGIALFGPDDLDELPDGLHPSPEGYRRIAARFEALAFGSAGPLRLA